MRRKYVTRKKKKKHVTNVLLSTKQKTYKNIPTGHLIATDLITAESTSAFMGCTLG